MKIIAVCSLILCVGFLASCTKTLDEPQSTLPPPSVTNETSTYTSKITVAPTPSSHENYILFQDIFILQEYAEEEIEELEQASELVPLNEGCIYISESLYFNEFEMMEINIESSCSISIGEDEIPDGAIRCIIEPVMKSLEQTKFFSDMYLFYELPKAKIYSTRKGDFWSSTINMVGIPLLYQQVILVNNSTEPQEVGFTVSLLREKPKLDSLNNHSITVIEPGQIPIIENNRIAFCSDPDEEDAGIFAVDPEGFHKIRLTFSETFDFLPSWSPDGSKIGFISMINQKRSICVVDFNSSKRINIAEGLDDDDLLYPVWSPDSRYILFNSYIDGDYEIYCVTADGEHVYQLTNNFVSSDVHPSWSPDGKRIVFISNRQGYCQVYSMNPDGSDQRQLTDSPSYKKAPSWSPDGNKILFINYQGEMGSIYTMNPDGTELKQLTIKGTVLYQPRWSPDSKKIAFVSESDERAYLFVMDLDGTNIEQLTSINTFWNQMPFSWSPGSDSVAFSTEVSNNGSSSYDILIIDIDGLVLRNITNSTADDFCPEWSP